MNFRGGTKKTVPPFRIALSEEYGLFAYTWGSPCRVDRWYIREAGYTFLPEEPAAE